MANKKLLEAYVKLIEKQIAALEEIKIPRDADFDEILLIKTNIGKIRDDTLNIIFEVFENKDKFDEQEFNIIYSKYEAFEKLLNYLYFELNFIFLDTGVKLKKDVENESKKILPQIISFSSLFIAVVGLIISNIIIFDVNSIKNILITNLTFIFAISLIFYFFCLLWSGLIEEKNRKIVLFVIFPVILVFLILGIVLLGIFM